MTCDEMVDVYDSNRNKTGKVLRRCDLKNEHFLSVHVWIVNSKGEFLIQKRVETKRVEPGKWSVSGGVVDAGETSWEGCYRETFEEMGIKADKSKSQLVTQSIEPDNWGAWVDVWLVVNDASIKEVVIQKNEVSDARWVDLENLNLLISEGVFSSNVLFGLPYVVDKMKSLQIIT